MDAWFLIKRNKHYYIVVKSLPGKFSLGEILMEKKSKMTGNEWIITNGQGNILSEGKTNAAFISRSTNFFLPLFT